MPVFLYPKRTTAVPYVVQSIHHKNHVKKVMQMSQNNSILNLLEIEEVDYRMKLATQLVVNKKRHSA